MKVVRIRMLTAVFFADITPRKPSAGCDEPPIARISETVAMIERGVAQTMKQSAIGDEQVLDVLLERLPALDPPHAEPEVVVGGEEEVADQHRLDDEQPREGAAHHREAERLRVGVDLVRQPVAGERQRQEGADRDEVADVAHPVVVRALLVGLRLQELEGGVGRGDRAAERDVGDDAVDVDRHPGEVVDRVPDARSALPCPRRPRGDIMNVSQELAMSMIAGADHVEAEPESQVHQRDGTSPSRSSRCRGRTPRRRRAGRRAGRSARRRSSGSS